MKNLFKQTRVIYDAHQKEYHVEYKNFLFWRYYCCYKPNQYLTDEVARGQAITMARDMLNTVEIYRGSAL